jgi:hypothetical protein
MRIQSGAAFNRVQHTGAVSEEILTTQKAEESKTWKTDESAVYNRRAVVVLAITSILSA